MRQVAFDLEGPLSPQDNAYELMKLIPNGAAIFEAISRYDDLLTLEGKVGYEPGDTLALISPFLLHHGITTGHILQLAEKASLVSGAASLVADLSRRGWDIFCISTSYEPYARRIVGRIGIRAENLACTRFDIESLREMIAQEFSLVDRVEISLRGLRPVDDDARIKECLDGFFWRDLAATEQGVLLQEVQPVGGQRKVDALKRFARQGGLGEFVAVGDSITDAKMLRAVREVGGLAVAFNANEYALSHATVGLASTRLDDLRMVLDAWEEGGLSAVEELVREREGRDSPNTPFSLHWLVGREDLSRVLEVHRRTRALVRAEAARLG